MVIKDNGEIEVFARMTKNRAIGQNAFHIFSSGKLNFHGPKQSFNQYGIHIAKLVFLGPRTCQYVY